MISADFALLLPDFRSAERTYALITQVAGRAGRGQIPGEVIVQSFIPHHYAIDCAARLAEPEFYEKELHIRRMLRFPPFARLAALILSGPDQDLVRDQAERLANILKTLAYRRSSRRSRCWGRPPRPWASSKTSIAGASWPGGTHYRARCTNCSGKGLQNYDRAHKRGHVNVMINVDATDLM